MKTIIETIYEQSLVTPTKPIVIFENRAITYEELWNSAKRFALLLKQLGIENGSSIVFQSTYEPLYVIVCFGSHLAHCVFVPIEKKSTNDSIEEISSFVDAKLTISAKRVDGIQSMTYEDLYSALSVERDGSISFPDLDDAADIMFSTGTTGKPKGIVLSQRNLSETVAARKKVLGIKEGNTSITLVPINHVAPMREIYLNSCVGGTTILLDGALKMKTMFSYMKLYRVTSMYLPPAMINMMEQLSKNELSNYQDQIDFVYTASAPMQLSQREFMKRMLPKSRLFFSYGSSENGSVALLRYDNTDKDITCCGIPCPGVEIAILDADYNRLPTNNVGLVAIKGEQNFMRYNKMQELTASCFKNGFFLSNDMGYIDDEGYLYVIGRRDDVINIGGLKVVPSEIEIAAQSLDGVFECICFAIKDETTGEAPCLLIVKNDPNLTVIDISRSLGTKLDSYKVPKTILFVEKIERTSNGKPNRKYYKQLTKEELFKLSI